MGPSCYLDPSKKWSFAMGGCMRRNSSFTAVASALIAAAGALLLLAATIAIHPHTSESVARYFIYQLIGLVTAWLAIAAMRLLIDSELQYLRVGDLRGGARRISPLGVRDGESWGRVGPTFAVLVTVVTGGYLWLGNADRLGSVDAGAWCLALLVALPLAAMNAFTEETITRWTIAEGFAGSNRLVRLAPWISALVFGSVHYFGIPSGLPGFLMAGFLAWLLTRSVQDTRGIGWAWFIHFIQDVLIFSVMLTRLFT